MAKNKVISSGTALIPVPSTTGTTGTLIGTTGTTGTTGTAFPMTNIKGLKNLILIDLYSLPIKYKGEEEDLSSFFMHRLHIKGYEYAVDSENTLANIKRLADKINKRYEKEEENPKLKKISLSWYHRFITVITLIMAYAPDRGDDVYNYNRVRFNKSLNTVNIYPATVNLSVYISINIYSESTITHIMLHSRYHRSRSALVAQKEIYAYRPAYDKIIFIVNNLTAISNSLMLEHFDYIPVKKLITK